MILHHHHHHLKYKNLHYLPNSIVMVSVVFLFWFLCVGFSNCATRGSSSGGRQGQWQLLLNSTGVVGMHMALTHHNTVVMFDQIGAVQSGYPLRRRFHNGTRCNQNHNDLTDSTCYAHSVEYDIEANRVRPMRIDTDPWCSSGAFMSNGMLLQTGGFGRGAKRARLLRCTSHQCDWRERMETLSDERWYASSQRLPESERVVVVGGRRVFTYEFYPKTNRGEKSYELPFLHQTHDRNSRGNNLYPFLHLSSDGNLFIFANRDSVLFNMRTNRVIKTFPRIPGNGSRNYPSSGSSVMLPLSHRDKFQKVEVMVCGGAASGAFPAAKEGRRFLNGLGSCGRMVITGNHHKWNMENMPGPRLLHDMLILPTGQILIINGARRGSAGYDNARSASRQPYLYSPNKILGRRFRVLKSTKIARMYHSSAILLPDGRVLVSGSNPHARYTFHKVAYPTELRLQAFVPHYMDKRYENLRPGNLTIQYGGGRNHSNSIGYGREFTVRFIVQAKLGNEVDYIVYAPPFTTHSLSMNQRMLKLECKRSVKSDGWVSAVLEAPPSSTVAPSGYYLLTVVNQGIPSMSQWIKFMHA